MKPTKRKVMKIHSQRTLGRDELQAAHGGYGASTPGQLRGVSEQTGLWGVSVPGQLMGVSTPTGIR